MTFSERVLALTQDALLPKVVDNSLGGNILSFRIIGQAKQGKGESIKKAIKYTNSGTGTSFAGLDTFSASQLDTKVRMSYDMRAYRQPIAISGMEAVANQVPETQVTDLVKEALEETQQELMDQLGTLVYGTGTGNNNKDFIGIGAIVDDATDVSTIGGLSRSTYSVLNATRTASGGTLTLNKLATLYSNVSSGTSMSTPTIIISNEVVWDLYEQLLTPIVREQYSMMGYYKVGVTGGAVRGQGEGLVGTQGFAAVTYKGIPWVRDEKCTAQNIFMLNENWIDWYGWDASKATSYKKISLGSETIEGLYEESPMSQFSGFNWSGFNTPTNQFGSIADIILLGNMVSWQPRRNGRLTGVTGV
jgi:hypothetical protein